MKINKSIVSLSSLIIGLLFTTNVFAWSSDVAFKSCENLSGNSSKVIKVRCCKNWGTDNNCDKWGQWAYPNFDNSVTKSCKFDEQNAKYYVLFKVKIEGTNRVKKSSIKASKSDFALWVQINSNGQPKIRGKNSSDCKT